VIWGLEVKSITREQAAEQLFMFNRHFEQPQIQAINEIPYNLFMSSPAIAENQGNGAQRSDDF